MVRWRCELTDHDWLIIEPVLMVAVGGNARALRPLDDLLPSTGSFAGARWGAVRRSGAGVRHRLLEEISNALTENLGEGSILLADKGYDSNAILTKATEGKAWANLPPTANCTGNFVFSS